MTSLRHILPVALIVAVVAGRPDISRADIEEEYWHQTGRYTAGRSLDRSGSQTSRSSADLEDETTSAYWNNLAQSMLKTKTKVRQNTNQAKNIIIFLGDGMSIPTLAAARMYLGQLKGETGEEDELHWESFPYSGLSKTYCVDSQVADSACSATAYLTGVKTNDGVIGLNAGVSYGDCEAMTNTSNHLSSIAQWALEGGKSAGIVTTTRVTHASPSGTYARTADRNWESDADVNDDGFNASVCLDIATQLITTYPGQDFQVILGGGRREFLPTTTVDDEGDYGYREDGVDLIETWKQDKTDRDSSYSYVWNRSGLRQIIDNPDDVDYLLGLFESSHCQYQLEADPVTEPTLTEMTEAAIKILQKNSNGYFLFVEGGRIDHAHHSTYTRLALAETVELASAVRIADEMTDESDTLILVTADHAHVMSLSGYPVRGNDILGLSGINGADGLPYTTLSYANGPGYKTPSNSTRYDLSEDDFTYVRYEYPAMVPLNSETHGGDDVAIFTRGPWSHLFTGTLEQNTIPHFMAYAACIGSGLTACT
ncbi:membrane-bound alkaline phosphatase-like [Neodiprion virginianus]|uniref:membrane-bound alkaline phosphatase-like n=1 Tax=Neodiprion fabricii TaxID=2872261 RepID=UPI001ED9386E|nr:membrane-bound alkaline phosphatase-like [Neodiprion fabricii]XP_046623001.1 membrane-bound alkaline phosphatase-like [Neodiprion virginianus]